MERRLAAQGKEVNGTPIEELEALWQEAKESDRIRELHYRAELREAVALQKTIWGFEDADLLPFRMFVVATKIGGQLLGAFDDEPHGRVSAWRFPG